MTDTKTDSCSLDPTAESAGKGCPTVCWKRDLAYLSILLLVGLACRLYTSPGADHDSIKNPITDHISFRQGTEAMMARHFHRNGIEIQYPQVMGYSAGSRLWINEFPLYPATLAVFYRAFGEEVRIGRILSIIFSLGTGAIIFFVLRNGFTNTAPYWGTLLFLVSPMGAYAGRCVIRHPMAFFFQALALLFWLKWIQKPTWKTSIVTGLAATITIMMNFPNAYIGVPMAVALVLYRGIPGLLDKRVWALGAAILVPPILWLRHTLEFGAMFLASAEGAAKQRDLGRFLRLEWWNDAFFEKMSEGFTEYLLNPVGIALLLLGLTVFWRSKLAWVARAWLAAALFYLCVDHYPIYINPHDYYFLHLLMPAAMVGGIGAGAIVGWVRERTPRFKKPAAALATLALVGLVGYHWNARYFPLWQKWTVTEPSWIPHWLTGAEKIRELTKPDDLVLVDRPEDALIYYCDRPGWVEQPNLSKEALESLIANGAEYLLITTFKMDESGFTGFHFDDPPPTGSSGAKWVRENCVSLHNGLTYEIIDLQPEKHGRQKPAAVNDNNDETDEKEEQSG